MSTIMNAEELTTFVDYDKEHYLENRDTWENTHWDYYGEEYDIIRRDSVNSLNNEVIDNEDDEYEPYVETIEDRY